MPKVGERAPEFTLPSTRGAPLALSALRGKKVVLYFYPKDDTPGCTREACAFRDEQAALRRAGAVVLGVSRDTLAAHARFRAKYALPFELLSDPDSAVAKAYGAYGKKVLYGKPAVGSIRSTFLIDEHGRIARVWSPVRVDGHAAEVLAALAGAQLQGAAPRATPKARAPKAGAPRRAKPRSAKVAAGRPSARTRAAKAR